MFQEWFANMHEILDEIAIRYPHASDEERDDLNEQVDLLQEISMDCCEHWLMFEEKLAQWKETQEVASVLDEDDLVIATDDFQKGEGYFTLLMFHEANVYFQKVIHQHPEFYMGRVYSGICMLETGQLDEASRHLSLVISLAN